MLFTPQGDEGIKSATDVGTDNQYNNYDRVGGYIQTQLFFASVEPNGNLTKQTNQRSGPMFGEVRNVHAGQASCPFLYECLAWTGLMGTHHDLLLLQPPGHLHVDDLLVAEVQARQALRGVAHAVLLAGDDGAAGAVHDATCGGQQNARVTGAGGALVSPGLNKQHQSSGFDYGLFIFQSVAGVGPGWEMPALVSLWDMICLVVLLI